jgi:hypothetical protein
MKVTDEILNEWSFRCHDGVVDLNDPIKLSVLHEIIEEYEINEAMLSLKSIQKRPDQFINIFYSKKPFKIGNKDGDDFTINYIEIGGIIYKSEDIDEKSELVGAFRDVSNARDINLVGELNGQETTLSISKIYKSASLGGQEGGGRGVSNENELVNKINSCVEENDNKPINISFIATKGAAISIDSVTGAENMGTKYKNLGYKGDIKIISTDGSENLSVKKDGPYWWSSERKLYSDLLNKFVEAGKKGEINRLILKENPLQPYILDMIDPEDNRRYGVVVITNYSKIDTDLNNIVFGKDNAKIVQQSFSESDFDFQNGNLAIKTKRNISNLEELEEGDKPVIWLARHENQKYGIDFRTVPLKQINFESKRGGKLLNIDYNNTPSLK